jgi:uncharacterized protein YqkB
MEITITEQAAEKIKKFKEGKKGFVKLKYDTEDCGCVMCGVTNLWLVSELDDQDDYKVVTNDEEIYVEKSKEVFLDDRLSIDYNVKSNCFVLKSPQQYINPRMGFFDKTNKE